MNKQAEALFVERLIGVVPLPRQSIIKGAISGTVLFFLAEYLSVVNSNAPRVPVAWLMIIATIMVESVLFFRVIGLLRTPRKENLFSLYRLHYEMRTAIASSAIRRSHRSFIPFAATILVIASLGETVLLHDRSFLMQCIIPVVTLLFMIGLEQFALLLIAHHAIPCTKKDHDGATAYGKRVGPLRKSISRYALPFVHRCSTLFPGTIRPGIMRNLLYLVRGEIILSLIITLVAPLLIVVLLLMVKDLHSPIITLLPLIAIFMMNHHFSAELLESTRKSAECHWYNFTPLQLLQGCWYTLALPALPVVITTCILLIPATDSPVDAVRVLNFLVAVAVILLIGCKNCMSGSSDSAPAMNIALFAIVAVGNFVPFAGVIFTLAAMGILFLIDGAKLLPKTSFHPKIQ